MDPAPIPAIVSVVTALTLSIASPPAAAAAVAIDNASFESPALGDGGFTSSITGWSASGGVGRGVFNPTTAHLVAPTDGVQVGYIDPDGHGTASIGQTLTALLEPGASYVLEADFAYRLNFTNTQPDFTLALLVGGVTVASFTGGPANGFSKTAFKTARVEFTTPTSGSSLGTPLGIFIGTAGEFATQIVFDNVRINASPVPLPTPALLFGSATMAMAFRRRARRG